MDLTEMTVVEPLYSKNKKIISDKFSRRLTKKTNILNIMRTYFSPFSFSSSSKYEYSRHDSTLYLKFQKQKKNFIIKSILLNYTTMHNQK